MMYKDGTPARLMDLVRGEQVAGEPAVFGILVWATPNNTVGNGLIIPLGIFTDDGSAHKVDFTGYQKITINLSSKLK